MGMSMYGGKSISYTSKDDGIHPNTKVTYRDQNGNESAINMKILLEKAKKCKNDFFEDFIRDVEGGGLQIGFPVIIALNHIAEELGEEAYEILEDKK